MYFRKHQHMMVGYVLLYFISNYVLNLFCPTSYSCPTVTVLEVIYKIGLRRRKIAVAFWIKVRLSKLTRNLWLPFVDPLAIMTLILARNTQQISTPKQVFFFFSPLTVLQTYVELPVTQIY